MSVGGCVAARNLPGAWISALTSIYCRNVKYFHLFLPQPFSSKVQRAPKGTHTTISSFIFASSLYQVNTVLFLKPPENYTWFFLTNCIRHYHLCWIITCLVWQANQITCSVTIEEDPLAWGTANGKASRAARSWHLQSEGVRRDQGWPAYFKTVTPVLHIFTWIWA
jgi:hypothetical protein